MHTTIYIFNPSFTIMTEQKSLADQQKAFQSYNQLRQEIQQITDKRVELEQQLNEHLLVEETLQNLDGGRRAYRLIGEVLVERTVEEIRPSIHTNRVKLEETIEQFKTTVQQKETELVKLQQEYPMLQQQTAS